jgi:hypothetical protein
MKFPNVQSKEIDRCVYCPAPGTSDEHVVALAFGGYHVLRGGSCTACQEITRDMETYLCEHNFNALRFHQGYPQRRRKKPRTRAPDLKIVEGQTPHNAPLRKIGADKAPGISIFPIFHPPGILLGLPPAAGINISQCFFLETSRDGARRTAELKNAGMAGVLAHAQFQGHAFARILAKIAHGYAVYNVGLNGFRSLLEPIIRGEQQHVSHYVGGTFPNGPVPILVPEPRGICPYQIIPFQIAIHEEMYLGVQIRLFATERPLTPVYTVIFGQNNP